MAMEKIADVRGKSADELQEMLVGLRKEQFNLRFQRATGQLEAVGRIKEVRRTIARVKPGRIMFEIDGVSNDTAREALSLGAAKLPIKTKIVARLGGAEA